jgi:predicted  nucleic acid-binding Zn-ribbon protein
MEESSDEGIGLAVLQSVRCLECGALYAKPTRGGTATVNPGCPECGYVGWVSATVPLRFAPREQRSEHRRVRSG